MSIPVGAVLWAVVWFSGVPGSSKAYDVGIAGSSCLAITLLVTAVGVRQVYANSGVSRVVQRRFSGASVLLDMSVGSFVNKVE